MNIAIIIPIYKSFLNLSKIEKKSFEQVLSILSNYSIIIITHENISELPYIALSNNYGVNLKIERFSSEYFDNISGYNKLMLDVNFYSRFYDFNYILIYQLDAWIFKDDLKKWCNKNYDYIGAPWLNIDSRDWIKLLPFKLRIIYKIKFRKLKKTKVGNGGFSLRRVDSSLKFLKKHSRLLKKWTLHEDIFWSFATILDKNFKIPDYMEALEFSIELNPKMGFEFNEFELPMGCHAWEKYEPEFWSKYIDINGRAT